MKSPPSSSTMPSRLPWVICVSILATVTTVLVLRQLVIGINASYEQESGEYIDAIVPRIVANWDAAILLEEASPEFLKATAEDSVQQMMRYFADELGALKLYVEASRTHSEVMWTRSGFVVTKEYLVDLIFHKGQAKLVIRIVRRQGVWHIEKFQILSNAFVNRRESIPLP